MTNTIYKRDFPELLKQIPDKAIPSKLYYRGNISLLEPTNSTGDCDIKFLCVVGSRRHTQYGRELVEKLIAPLKDYNIVVISGLAYGIDTIAHQIALENGIPTIAIPGSGINSDSIYPKAHRGIAEEIVREGGLLISEFEPDSTPQPWYFPQRNRIMAGLAHAVLIIEAADRSGTLITAKLALDYNRSILAVPGSVFSPHSEGTNALIRDGAEVVLSHEDILRSLGIDIISETNLSDIEKQFISLVDGNISTSQIGEKLNISATQASTVCSYLCLKGILKEFFDIPSRT